MLNEILKELEAMEATKKEQYLLNEIAKLNNDLYELTGILRDVTSSNNLKIGTNKIRELSDNIKTACYHTQGIIYHEKTKDDNKLQQAVKALDRI